MACEVGDLLVTSESPHDSVTPKSSPDLPPVDVPVDVPEDKSTSESVNYKVDDTIPPVEKPQPVCTEEPPSREPPIENHMPPPKLHKNSFEDIRKEALQNGSVDIIDSNIALFGLPQSGKTTVNQSLLQEQQQCYPDSDGFTKGPTETLQPHDPSIFWKQSTEEEKIKNLAESIAFACHTFENWKIDEFKEQISKLKIRPDSIFSQALDNLENISKIEKNLTYKPEFNIPLSEYTLPTHKSLIASLPSFFTSHTIFCLLYDASLKEEELASTRSLYDVLLMNIQAHLATGSSEESAPHIVSIGTRGDRLKKTRPWQSDRVEEVKDKMKTHCMNQPYGVLIEDYHIIGNTSPNGSDDLRESLSALISKEKVPIQWDLYRRIIQSLNANVITLNEAKVIGVACHFSEEFIPNVLGYFHDKGKILYYPHIDDLIIVNPQWFVNVLVKLFMLVKNTGPRTHLMWKFLEERGILVESLCRDVWNDIKDITPDRLVKLLVSLRIACEVETNLWHNPIDKQYLLLHMLEECTDLTPNFNCHQQATPLHLTFSTKFILRGYFTRLVNTMAASPHYEIQFDRETFCNKLTFSFGTTQDDYVTLTEVPLYNAIQVDVYRNVPYASKPFGVVCQELKEFLLECVRDIEKLYHSRGDVSLVKGLKFCCVAGDCKSLGLHYLSRKTGQVNSVECSITKHGRTPLKEEAVWFVTKSEAPNKKSVGPNDRIEGPESLRIASLLDPNDVKALVTLYDMKKHLNCYHPTDPRTFAINFLEMWGQLDGRRSQLVDALRKIDLNRLALMVEQGEYEIGKLKGEGYSAEYFAKFTDRKKSSSSKPQEEESSDLKPPISIIRISDPVIIEYSNKFNHRNITDLVYLLDDPDILKLQDVAKLYPTPQKKAFHVLKKWAKVNDADEIGLRSKLEELGLIQSSLEEDQTENDEGYELVKAPHVVFSVIELQTVANVIEKDIPILASGLDFTIEELQQMQQNYGREVRTLAYRILKNFCDAHPEVTKEDLRGRLYALGFRNAAKKVCPQSQQHLSCLIL